MQWNFRRTLQSFENFKNALSFKEQINKGNNEILTICIRQIQLILAQPQGNPITKVLSLRFLRDCMIFGKQNVINAVQKLVPQIMKICSYRIESDQFNRGQTYFHDLPSYAKGSVEQQKQLDSLGFTFLVLSLESIYHWAQWIPKDLSGNPSVYQKAYDSLIQRHPFQQRILLLQAYRYRKVD